MKSKTWFSSHLMLSFIDADAEILKKSVSYFPALILSHLINSLIWQFGNCTTIKDPAADRAAERSYLKTFRELIRLLLLHFSWKKSYHKLNWISRLNAHASLHFSWFRKVWRSSNNIWTSSSFEGKDVLMCLVVEIVCLKTNNFCFTDIISSYKCRVLPLLTEIN